MPPKGYQGEVTYILAASKLTEKSVAADGPYCGIISSEMARVVCGNLEPGIREKPPILATSCWLSILRVLCNSYQSS